MTLMFSFLFMTTVSAELTTRADGEVGIDLRTPEQINYTQKNVNSSEYWDNLNTPADILFSDLTWNFGNNWNYISGDNFYFNDSKLETKYYNATSLETVAGTGTGTISDIQSLEDGTNYTITEVNSAPAIDFRVNFTDVDEFNQLYLRTTTNKNQEDTISIQLYNYDTGSWNTQNSFVYLDDYQIFQIGIFNRQYISGDGTVQLRLYQGVKGKTNEEIYIDWVELAKGYGTPSSTDIFFQQNLNLTDSNLSITDGNSVDLSQKFLTNDGDTMEGSLTFKNNTEENKIYTNDKGTLVFEV